MNEERCIALVNELRKLPAETEWVEFKTGNADPKRIGKTISAIANGACIWGEPNGYVIWGIEDGSHNVVGTTFEPKKERHGGQILELWLASSLNPSPSFKFIPVNHPSGKLVLLEIPAANSVPVKFNSIAYIRIGNTTPKLSDYPDREADLLSKLRPFIWEHGAAANFIDEDIIRSTLDLDAYFRLLKQRVPSTTEEVFRRLLEDRLISKDVGGRWNILNLGAILFATKLATFADIERKALRVIHYEGDSRVQIRRSQDGSMGYAAGFSGALGFIDSLLPAEERIVGGIRTPVRVYPNIAIRELVANALIHQDMTISGTGPLVEVFDNRIEISNPGIPVTEMAKKLFGAPPRSRNEQLGRLMRRMGMCEELGSGLVKIIAAVEEERLPAPIIETADGTTRVVLYGPREFSKLSRLERMNVCYQHACLMCHRQSRLTNASLRGRFGLDDEKVAIVSRIIRDTAQAEWIVPADPDHPNSGYLPFWG